MTLTDLTRSVLKTRQQINREVDIALGHGSLHRLVGCVRSLGPKLGWKYWRIGEKARNHPELITAWATRCRREAIIAPEPFRSAYLKWAEELETCLEKWSRQEASNKKLTCSESAVGANQHNEERK